LLRCITVILVLAAIPCFADDPLVVFFVDPTHDDFSGDAMVIRTPAGRTFLIDGGYLEDWAGGYWSCGEERILPLLDSLEVDYLHGVVATHPDADHVGGLIAVLDAFEGRVGTVWDSGYPYSASWIYEEFLQEVQQSGAAYVTPSRGDTLNWGGELLVQVYNPRDFVEGEKNNASIVLRLTYEDIAFLFTGDLEEEGEEEILAEIAADSLYGVSAEVLKVAHHGSHSSTSMDWLEAVGPQWAAICVGAGNPYGHPHGEVLNRLYAMGTDVYRTDVHGTFYFATEGQQLYYNDLPESGGGGGPEEVSGLLVYPSPATSQVSFRWDSETEGAATVRVYNLLGEEVYSRTGGSGEINWNLALDGGGVLSPGLYMARMVTENGGTWNEYFAVAR
jgi:beta-lactamase superfamily II metal-dependent hydrolase